MNKKLLTVASQQKTEFEPKAIYLVLLLMNLPPSKPTVCAVCLYCVPCQMWLLGAAVAASSPERVQAFGAPEFVLGKRHLLEINHFPPPQLEL